MLEETLKSERGKFLLRHLSDCQKCYDEWCKISNTIPSGRHVAKIQEIVNYTHPDSTII